MQDARGAAPLIKAWLQTCRSNRTCLPERPFFFLFPALSGIPPGIRPFCPFPPFSLSFSLSLSLFLSFFLFLPLASILRTSAMRTCLLRGWALHLPLASVICIWHDIRSHFAQTLDNRLSKGASRTLAPEAMFAFSVSTGLRAAVRGLASTLTARRPIPA